MQEADSPEIVTRSIFRGSFSTGMTDAARVIWRNICIVVVKALFYKPEGRGFETRSGELIFFLNLSNPSGRTRSWGLVSF
jgi:hypothetical protein